MVYSQGEQVAVFPALFHAHHQSHSEDLPFWCWLADSHSGPCLELGCGTGRVLIQLAQAGIKVVGLDLDYEMLKYLKNNLTERLSANLLFFQADFLKFRLAIQFGLIFLPCNTYSTLSTEQRQQLLECVLEHLQPGGVFAVSMPNPQLLKRLPPHSEAEIEQVFPHPLDGEPVQVSSAWQREGNDLTILWHYDHLLPDGVVDRLTAQVTHHLNSIELYIQEFHIAGFEQVQLFGDFTRSKYVANSPDLIFIASG